MRFAQQPWNAIVARLDITVAGVGSTGKSPTVAVRRVSDGQWLQSGGGSWGAGLATNAMTEVDSVNLPGLYEYSVPSARLVYASSAPGYRIAYFEGTTPVAEHEFIAAQSAFSPWDDLRSEHTTSGSFGQGSRLFELASAGTAFDEVGHAVWRRDATIGAYAGGPTGSEPDWTAGGTLQQTYWAAQVMALIGGLLKGNNTGQILICDNAHAGGSRFYVLGSTPGSGTAFVGFYAVYYPTGSGVRPLSGLGAGSRQSTLVRITGVGADGTGNYVDIVDAVTGSALPIGIAVDDWLIPVQHSSIGQARDVWTSDVETMMGGSGGVMLPGATSAVQRSAAGVLAAVADASVQGFKTSGNTWVNAFVSSGTGTTTKFYYTSTDGPAVVDSAQWAGKSAVLVTAASGRRRLVKVTSVATDGAVHFVLALPDGSALPSAPAANDRLIVLQDTRLAVGDIFTASMAGYETAGTFGNHINRILRLRQENMRVVYTAWADNNEPTAGYVLTYASSADLDGDTGPGWALAKGRHDFTATYNDDLQLTGYESVRTL